MRAYDLVNNDNASLIKSATMLYMEKLVDLEHVNGSGVTPETIAAKVGAFARAMCAEMTREMPYTSKGEVKAEPAKE